MSAKDNLTLVFLVFCSFNFIVIHATLSPRTSKETKTKSQKLPSGPTEKCVFESDLVNKEPTAKEIIKNHLSYYKNTSVSKVDGLSLGYVTPWNNHGYDIAKIFANKFSHVSPVWLQIKRNAKLAYEVTGTHDIDKNWMKDVIHAGKKRRVKIVPRILLEGWTSSDFRAIFENVGEASALVKTLADACSKWKFNGFVLEGWSQLFGHVANVVEVIKLIVKQLKSVECEAILVLPPKRGDEKFDLYIKKVFDELYSTVSAFSLMTYDYSSVQRPGPNAPIQWIKENILFLSPTDDKREKILTGLNFYGNAYTPNGGDSIIGSRYLELLKKFKGKMPYDPDSAEHYFEIKDGYQRFIIFYPTLHSINERINLVNELGTGISIWELGQGLDYFYDLI